MGSSKKECFDFYTDDVVDTRTVYGRYPSRLANCMCVQHYFDQNVKSWMLQHTFIHIYRFHIFSVYIALERRLDNDNKAT